MSGAVADGMPAVVTAIEANVESGRELGLSLCVIWQGRVLLDYWAGWQDSGRTVRWERDTIAPVWSLSKTVVNLGALVLLDSGELSLDRPVAAYWPELAAAGHSEVTARQILQHSAGIPAWPSSTPPDTLWDWDHAVDRLINQPAWWPAGRRAGYHVMSQGHLMGEIIRRISGTTVDQYLRERVLAPLGADFQFGVQDQDASRTAETDISRNIADVDPLSSLGARVRSSPFVHLRRAESAEWRRALIPAANGFSNARGIARINAMVSQSGRVDGATWLSSRTIAKIWQGARTGHDVVLNLPISWGLGFALPHPDSLMTVPSGRVCYWGGIGGAFVLNDLDRELTFACVPNRLTFEAVPGRSWSRPCGSARSDEYLALVYQDLDRHSRSGSR